MIDRFSLTVLRAVAQGVLFVAAALLALVALVAPGGADGLLSWALAVLCVGIVVGPCAQDRDAVLSIIRDRS